MTDRISKLLLSLDIFGHMIGVHYKGNETYQTRLGVFFTLAVYALAIFNLVSLSTAFNDGSN